MTSLAVQLVKIDRGFTAPVNGSTPMGRRALEVVRGIVTIATALGLPTVAEGIETPEQLQLLSEAGCSYFQGYLFGRPQPLM